MPAKIRKRKLYPRIRVLRYGGGGVVKKLPSNVTGIMISLVPRPTCVFHFSAAVGLVYFLTGVTRRVEGR